MRIDGRGSATSVRLSAEVGIVSTAHGSGLFQRGDTQVLNVCTLGMPRMEQMIDSIGVDDHKRYMHHYNMPPYANGETGRVGSPKRREIGHGLLAERALLPVVPGVDEFPYTLRLVSEVLASNGSTSMASVCASTLSLMDAGVPIKAPVAGIAMGLVFAEGKYTTLTDILGAEDAFGDMDFKVAGTSEFVTALQLDTKIDGLPADVLGQALDQAREARLAILDVMNAAIASPRPDVRETAPKIVSFEIPMDKIGEVIGPKGKVINTIQQETGADVNVDDDGKVGTVTIGAKDGLAVAEARRRIELILDPPAAQIGTIYPGRVVNVTKFGAFVNILPGRDGLLHISKIGGGKRIERVEDVLNLGDEVEVRVDDIDPQGKVSLSLVGDEPADGAPERVRGGFRWRPEPGRRSLEVGRVRGWGPLRWPGRVPWLDVRRCRPGVRLVRGQLPRRGSSASWATSGRRRHPPVAPGDRARADRAGRRRRASGRRRATTRASSWRRRRGWPALSRRRGWPAPSLAAGSGRHPAAAAGSGRRRTWAADAEHIPSAHHLVIRG